MHPINQLLARLGLRVGRAPRIPADFVQEYRRRLKGLKASELAYSLYQDFHYDAVQHPLAYYDYECGFAAEQIRRCAPKRVLDIGSYRGFVLGLLAHYEVTTLDVRARPSMTPNEHCLVADAKRIDLPSEHFDLVLSLCAIEHFGLGRYGDGFDLDGDKKAIAEMIRVLKPGGCLVLSTNVTRAQATLVFNAHRIYTRELLHSYFQGLELESERYFSQRRHSLCRFDEVTTERGSWDVYMGCWRKSH
jgi:SAM-dependent methyltransferase